VAWQRLSGADAVSLNTETPATPAHYVVLFVTEPSDAVSHQRLHELVGSSLPRLARFRSRLFSKPLGLGQPVWAEVTNFDPSRQMHKVAVPPPGGTAEFADVVAKLTTRPLVRHKPLWQAWSIEGLAGGRWALALKISQAMIAGVDGLASILARLLTVDPDDDPVGYLPDEPSLGRPPSVVELVTDAAAELTERPFTGARVVGEAVPGVLRSVVGLLRSGNMVFNGPLPRTVFNGPLPRTVFNDPLTPRREIAFAELRKADIDAVADAFNVSGDDVFLAACTLSLRSWLHRHARVPQRPLVLQVLLSSTRVRLPVQLDDPVGIVGDCHADRDHENRSELSALGALVPPYLLHATMRLYTRLGLARAFPPVLHGVTATINGPPVPVYCAGARVAAIHVVPPLPEGAGLSITQVLHDQAAGVTVCACPDRVTGVEEIADGIVYGLTQLRAKRKRQRQTRRRP
jgi:diacylglycerol O-acyltransferase / wax synthase